MNAQELLTYPASPQSAPSGTPRVDGSAPLAAVMDAMTGASCPVVEVHSADRIAPLTSWQILQAVTRMMPHSDEFSEIMAHADNRTYSASAMARAVEDSDASLISLLTYPDDEGGLNVYLRINRADPSHAARSLERYGYSVTYAHGPENSEAELSEQRLTELQHYLNI